jgi:predicted nucleic acid-binding protein
MASVFLLDTNILTYAVDRRDPAKRELALEALAALRENETGAVSTQTLAEFYVSATARIPDPLSLLEAGARLAEIAATFAVHEITLPIVLEAARAAHAHQMSYWDAQVWATAKLNQIPFVLSEDFQGWGSLEGVRCINPLVDGFKLSSLAGP